MKKIHIFATNIYRQGKERQWGRGLAEGDEDKGNQETEIRDKGRHETNPHRKQEN